MSHLYRSMSVKWWGKLPPQQASNMTIQGVVNYFTDSTGFGVQSQLDLPPSSLATQDEEDLRRLMCAPTKEELRQLVQEIKRNFAQNSPSSSVIDKENVPNLFQDAQDPYHEFSPYN